MGVGWGPTCEICPAKGTNQFKELCHSEGMVLNYIFLLCKIFIIDIIVHMIGMNNLGEDIDECKTMADLCQKGQCINTLGSFR